MFASPIPPAPELTQDYWRTDGNNYHLILAHLCDIPGYQEFFEARGQAGDFITLDNGAHERHAGMQFDKLLKLGQRFKAAEIVLPDVLFDGPASIARTREALYDIHRNSNGMQDLLYTYQPTLMMVPQGANYTEWKNCLKEMLLMYESYLFHGGLYNFKPVIGVSKDYDEMFSGGLARAFKSVLEPLKSEIAVHCLGWPSDLWNFTTLLQEHPWVRSTDSARAFVYALAGIELNPGMPYPRYPKRPPGYFETELTEEQRRLAAHNVAAYVQATRGAVG